MSEPEFRAFLDLMLCDDGVLIPFTLTPDHPRECLMRHPNDYDRFKPGPPYEGYMEVEACSDDEHDGVSDNDWEHLMREQDNEFNDMARFKEHDDG